MICAGIDLGGTGIKAALVDEQGRILRKKTIPTGAARHWKEIMRDIVGLITDLVQEEGLQIQDIKGVGVHGS